MQHPLTIALRRILKKTIIQMWLEAISVATHLNIFPNLSAKDVIFTLHRVEPQPSPLFNPSAHLSVTPEFLEETILALKAKNYTAIALKDVPQHLANPESTGPIMAFTLDDGYRNNLEYALPIFKKHNIPFTVFACSGFINRTHTMWWETVQHLANKVDHLKFDFGFGMRDMPARTLIEKYALYENMGLDIMAGNHSESVQQLDKLARLNGIDPKQVVDDLIMNAGELKQLSQDPLVDIGAHTVSHDNLTQNSDDNLRYELNQSRDEVEQIVGYRPRHLAFPYGKVANASSREFKMAKELGFDVSVITEPDVLHKDAGQDLHALHRISLNGYYQKPRYVKALASAFAFKFKNL
jgi:peptidoglycan/xylan/chitin deacetylase (PgdA/CDA1 family)